MTEERINTAYSKAVAEQINIAAKQDEESHLNRMLSESQKTTDAISKCIENVPAEIDKDIDSMETIEEELKFIEQNLIDCLDKMNETYKEKVEKQTLHLNAQNDKYDGKVVELAEMQKAYDDMQIILKEEKDKFAELQKQLSVENSLLEEQRRILLDLKSRANEQKTKFLEDQKALQSDRTNNSSAKLDALVCTKQAEIDETRKETSAMAEELAALDVERDLKLGELSALQSRLDESKAKYAHEEMKNFEIMKKIKAREEMEADEISEWKRRVAEQEATLRHTKRMHDNLKDKMRKEFGCDPKSLRQMKIEAEAELLQVKAECLQLRKSVGTVQKSTASNNIKLAKLNKEKEQLAKSGFSEGSSTSGQQFQQSVGQHNQEKHKGIVFKRPQPLSARRSVKKSGRRNTQETRPQVAPVVETPDSEPWLSTSGIPAEAQQQTGRNLDTLQILKKYFLE